MGAISSYASSPVIELTQVGLSLSTDEKRASSHEVTIDVQPSAAATRIKKSPEAQKVRFLLTNSQTEPTRQSVGPIIPNPINTLFKRNIIKLTIAVSGTLVLCCFSFGIIRAING